MNDSILATVRNDLLASSHYISKVKPSILKTLMLVAIISFFIQGVALIGLPYIVRNTLGLSANHYGAAESLLGLAGLAGSITAGLTVTKVRISKLAWTIIGMGLFLLPIGVAFLFPASPSFYYIVLLAFSAAIQVIASIFSVFGLSIIQQLTPQNMAQRLCPLLLQLLFVRNQSAKSYTESPLIPFLIRYIGSLSRQVLFCA